MQLVTIQVYEDFFKASRDKQWLMSNGLTAYIANELTIQTDWLLHNALNGIQLQVFEEDVEVAQALLKQSFEEVEVEFTLDPPPFSFNCPSCGSNHIYRDEKPGGLFGVSILFLGFPIRLKSSVFHCRYCQHTWKQKE